MRGNILMGNTLARLREIARESGLPAFAAAQLADWLYKKDVTSIGGMTNLSAKARQQLAARFELGALPPIRAQTSADGTRKYLFPAREGRFVESAYMPDAHRHTLCVSSQVGCKMGCLFCLTGKQGFQANLSSGEIINQVRSLPERRRLTNLVYMGMGEPMDNLHAVLDSLEILTADYGFAMSPRRITVSTVGIIPAMQEFLDRSDCHLAISVHSPFDEDRRRLMPVQLVHPLDRVLDAVRKHPFGRQRRVSIEYVLFKDFNDTPRHVKELARVLNGIRCRINLMRFHPIPGAPLQGSDEKAVADFQTGLRARGIVTTIRQSRGLDIAAACGMLSTRTLGSLTPRIDTLEEAGGACPKAWAG